MDEHAPAPTSSTSSPPSPASFFSTAGNGLVLEFPYTEVPEQWLMDMDQPVEHGAVWGDGGSLSPAGSADLPRRNTPAAVPAKRGRKPGSNAGGGPAVSHVEAERHRRDKLHRRFCDLRAAVPNVTRMDKASSLLGDAAAYIAELRARVEQLEAQVTRAAARKANYPFFFLDDDAAAAPGGEEEGEELEVRMVVGREAAAVRLTTAAATRHAPARLMDALRSLDLAVQQACACRAGGGVTVQDAVVDVPAELRDEGCLHAALLHRLRQHSG